MNNTSLYKSIILKYCKNVNLDKNIIILLEDILETAVKMKKENYTKLLLRKIANDIIVKNELNENEHKKIYGKIDSKDKIITSYNILDFYKKVFLDQLENLSLKNHLVQKHNNIFYLLKYSLSINKEVLNKNDLIEFYKNEKEKRIYYFLIKKYDNYSEYIEIKNSDIPEKENFRIKLMEIVQNNIENADVLVYSYKVVEMDKYFCLNEKLKNIKVGPKEILNNTNIYFYLFGFKKDNIYRICRYTKSMLPNNYNIQKLASYILNFEGNIGENILKLCKIFEFIKPECKEKVLRNQYFIKTVIYLVKLNRDDHILTMEDYNEYLDYARKINYFRDIDDMVYETPETPKVNEFSNETDIINIYDDMEISIKMRLYIQWRVKYLGHHDFIILIKINSFQYLMCL